MEERIKKLEEINQYYHEQIEQMLHVLYFIEDEFEIRYGIPLPLEFYQKVTTITKSFNFKY